MKNKLLAIIIFGIFCLESKNYLEAILLDQSQLIAWYGSSYKNETHLFLDHKEISSIATDAFQGGLIALKYLTLDFNLLTSIDSATFNSLTNLERLSIASNQLNRIDSAVIFSRLFNLKVLNLAWNQLTSMDRNAFMGLIYLEKVYMGSNPLTYLQPAYVLKLCSPQANPICTIYL
jgi:Leucine-rich repeat (LRR) protein